MTKFALIKNIHSFILFYYFLEQQKHRRRIYEWKPLGERPYFSWVSFAETEATNDKSVRQRNEEMTAI